MHHINPWLVVAAAGIFVVVMIIRHSPIDDEDPFAERIEEPADRPDV